jgi:hypothetical protein
MSSLVLQTLEILDGASRMPRAMAVHSAAQAIVQLRKMFFRDGSVSIYDGTQLPDSEYEEILKFRQRIYSTHSPHLLENRLLLAQDPAIDERSTHIVLRREGQVQGVLRLNAERMGIKSAFPEEVAKFPGLVEISRLVAEPGQGVGKWLMMSAGIHLVQSQMGRGLIAIARAKNVPLFNRFGMSLQAVQKTPDDPFDRYHLMTATTETLAARASAHFLRSLF